MARNPDNWADQQLSGGRYRVTAKLGEGGMGYVYRARDANLGSDVVIKVPKLAMLVERQFQERFVRELRSLVKLSHPHIVTITDVGREGKIPYAVMQFLSGGDLTARLSSDPARLADWLPAIAAALDYVHKQGFVHRDVKPGNILFDEEGHAFLSDFGIAKVVSDTQQEQDNLTGTGMVVGTADYMAPELIMGKEIRGSIDQYALAITVYEALAGKRPFTGTTPSAIMVAHTTEQPAAIDGSPAGLQQALLRGMAKIPADRYANCSAFAEAISASLVGASVAASSYPLAPPSPPPLISTPDSARLDCPECGKSLRATAQAAGRSVTCPGCGVKLRVAEDLSGLAVRDPAAGSPGSSKETMILDPASGTSGVLPPLPGSGPKSPLPMDTDAIQATIDTSRRVRTDPAHVKAIGTLLHRAWDHIPKSINALVLVVVGLAVVVLFGLLGLALFSTDEFSTDDRPEAGKVTSVESKGTDLQPQQALQAQLEAERAARAVAEKKAAAQIARLEREKSTADKAVAEAERARLEREQAARAKAVREAAREKAAQEAARRKTGNQAALAASAPHPITNDLIPADAVEWNGHSYWISSDKASWFDAKSRCEALNGHLVRITSEQEHSFIKGMITRSRLRRSHYWTDGSDEASEGNWRFTNGQPVSYNGWKRGEPEGGRVCNYKALWSTSRWGFADDSGAARFSFICEWDGPDEKKVQTATESASPKLASQSKAKPPHPNAIKLGESYYALFTDKVNYKTAANRCISMGGTLAVIDAEQERSGVQRLLKGTPAWVGLTRAVGTREWIWLSGKPIKTNFPWSPGQPQYSRSELSVALWADGKFQDHHWWDRLHYVCEWKIDGNASDEQKRGLLFDGNGFVQTSLYYRGVTPITLEATVRPSLNNTSNESVVANTEASGVALAALDGHWAFFVHDGKAYKRAQSKNPIPPGKRVTLAGVFDGSTVKLFVDGVLQSSVPITAQKTSKYPFMVGANPDGKKGGGQHNFSGVIEEVKISAEALYDESYHPADGFETGKKTILLLKLDEGKGNIARDASKDKHHCRIHNAEWTNN